MKRPRRQSSFVSQFEDKAGHRLEVVSQRRKDGRWESFVLYRRQGQRVQQRGASVVHGTRGAARGRHKALEAEAVEHGWNLRVIDRADNASNASEGMRIVNGERLFTDRWNGEEFVDLSNWRPPGAPVFDFDWYLPEAEVAKPLPPVDRMRIDAFDLSSIPSPGEA